jgi:hypothetical protein
MRGSKKVRFNDGNDDIRSQIVLYIISLYYIACTVAFVAAKRGRAAVAGHVPCDNADAVGGNGWLVVLHVTDNEQRFGSR